jgi:hypothetical protein
MRLLHLLIFVTLMLLFTPALPELAQGLAPKPFAARINSDNLHLAIRGPAAIAGVGDWMLGNGTLCTSITDPSHETYLSHRGGTLVDLGFYGRNDDHFHTYHVPLVFAADAFGTVEIQGPATADYSDIYPGFYSFAFSNPVYVKKP